MSPAHLINRVSILGTGLIGGSFALALRKYTEGIHITAWDRRDTVARAKDLGAADEIFSGELKPAIESADLIYVALPISTTLDILPEIARHSPQHALVTDACSTKVRIVRAAEELFSGSGEKLFLGGHPMAGKESSGIANADPNLFRDTTYALIGESSSDMHDNVAPESRSQAEPDQSPVRPEPVRISKDDLRVVHCHAYRTKIRR
jgi:prephenate dehydrogenase